MSLVCPSQPLLPVAMFAEVEAAIHAMRELLEKDETEALLLVNEQVMLSVY